VLSNRILNISQSATAKVAAVAIQMRREKIDVVDFSIGEPDFPTPQNIKDAAFEAIRNDYSKYTLIPGTIALRQAIVQKLRRENDLDYDIENIIVSNGAKHAIYNILLTLVNRGDEVILPAPYWVSYPEIVKFAEGRPVIVQTSEQTDFKLTPSQLEVSLTDKTKVLILCSPSNPTGSIYSRNELAALAEVISGKDIIVLSDEIYEKLVYDGDKAISIAAISPAMKKQTIVVNGLSKAYAMTGWRIGYAAGEKEIIIGAGKLQSHSTTNASSISQFAGIEALNGPQDQILKMRDEFEKRRNFVYENLAEIDGILCRKPQGAFYAFPKISAFFNKSFKDSIIRNSTDMALFILKEAKVVLMPGEAFGSDNYIRISYATSMDQIKEGMKRIKAVLKKLN
jgi:aspartate aminotransferase